MTQNPHCPVKGCSGTTHHTDDPMVKVMMLMKPQELTTLVSQALLQIRESVTADGAAGRTFGWITRLRQVEELYMRCAYVLLLSPDDEVPHIFSSDTPNSFDFIYVKVNEAVFAGRGVLKDTKPGLTYGNFTPMKTIHNAAHASFQSLMTWKSSQMFPDSMKDYPDPKLLKHIDTYRNYLDKVGSLFAAGQDNATILTVLQNMHTPFPNQQSSQP
jgi:hypothetical protein